MDRDIATVITSFASASWVSLTFHSTPSMMQLSNLNHHHLQSFIRTSASLHGLPPNPTSSWATEAAPGLLSAASHLRGGAVPNFVLDMAKESHYLDVMASYGVLTVLILNSALRLYTSTHFKRNPSKKNDWMSPNLFLLCSGICVITGAFTGVMFQLLGIYHKSALGMGNPAGYAAFKAATMCYRRLGFHTFLTCLASFVGAFMISLRNMTKEDERFGDGIFATMAVLTLCGGIILKKVLHLATALIFAPTA